MRVIAEYDPTARSASRSSNARNARIPADLRMMLPRWCYAAAWLDFPLSGKHIEDIVQLERLVPKIERAQTLSLEARDTINRLIARQSTLGASNDPSHEMRRKAAIDRVTNAMRAKENSSTGSNVAGMMIE